MRQHKQNKLFFFLIKAILVFNVFAFSGFTGNAYSAIQTSTQSELVEEQDEQSNKQLRSFKQYIGSAPIPSLRIDLTTIRKSVLQDFNNNIPILIKAITQKYFSYNHFNLSFAIRRTVPSSDEDSLNLFLG